MAMEAGYVLFVECGENKYRIKVPEGGVPEGQVFTVQGKLRSSPILGGWRDCLFDCTKPTEDSFCFVSWCCTPLAFACLMEPLKMDCFFRRESNIPKGVVFKFMCLLSAVNTILYVMANQGSFDAGYKQGQTGRYSTQLVEPPNTVIGNVFTALVHYTFALYVGIRYFTRLKCKVPGNLFLDCLAAKFCTCCAALQIFRHMKASGNQPTSFTQHTKYGKATLASKEDCLKVDAKAFGVEEIV